MKKTWIFCRVIALILVLATVIMPVATIASARKSASDEALRVITDYSSTSLFILEKEFARTKGTVVSGRVVEDGVTQTYSRKIENIDDLVSMWGGGNPRSVSYYISVAVHEIYHGYQMRDATARSQVRHQLVDGSNVSYVMPLTHRVKTEEVTGGYTGALATTTWKNYVSKNRDTAANAYGIYGLLDEFSAYYYDLNALYESVDFIYESIKEHGIEADVSNASMSELMSYLHEVENNALAYYQFRYWMLEYLLYLQNKYPQEYSTLFAHTEFITVLSHFFRAYEDLVDNRMTALVASMKNELEKEGVEFTESRDRYTFSKTVGRSIYSCYMERLTSQVRTVISNLSSDKYAAVLSELEKYAVIDEQVVTHNQGSHTTVILQVGSPFIVVNSTTRLMDAEGTTPVVIDGLTLVPLKVIFELFGYDVFWDGGRITGTRNDIEIGLSIGSRTAYRSRLEFSQMYGAWYKNQEMIELITAPQLIGDRTMVPLKFVAESIDAKVEWIAETKMIVIAGEF